VNLKFLYISITYEVGKNDLEFCTKTTEKPLFYRHNLHVFAEPKLALMRKRTHAAAEMRRMAPRLARQILLPLAGIMRPVSRLREFGGGFVPPAVAHEIRFKLQQRGLSQVQLGLRIGRSQGQIANALRGMIRSRLRRPTGCMRYCYGKGNDGVGPKHQRAAPG